MKRPNFSLKYAAIIIGVVVLAYLVLAFNNRVVDLRHLAVQKELIAAELEGLEGTRASLETQIAYATSDAAVIDWAYEEGNTVQDGDHPVVPLSPAESTPVPTPTPVVTRPTVSNWQMWWLLFVDPPAQRHSP